MKTVVIENLMQLKDLLQVISKDAYNQKPDVLFGSFIGQHVRHILEFYHLLISGSFEGKISYDKRKRDTSLETNPQLAIEKINKLMNDITFIDNEEIIRFEADYSKAGQKNKLIVSSVGRELAYCIEHSIHHQALIKAGLIALGLKNIISEDFGVAYSTIKYRNDSCAQ